VLRATTQAIAKQLRNALIAPIVAFVPEGDIDPPAGHMQYPGSIGLIEDTFRRLLTDICAGFQTQGFRNIILIGDHGGNQEGTKEVADESSVKWANGQTRVRFISEYYDYAPVSQLPKDQGIREVPEGLRDDFAMESKTMFVDPTTVRMKERIAAGTLRINGVDLASVEKTGEWGRRIVNHRMDLTVTAIRKAIEW
jgi:creatinine amidohydrolase